MTSSLDWQLYADASCEHRPTVIDGQAFTLPSESLPLPCPCPQPAYLMEG